MRQCHMNLGQYRVVAYVVGYDQVCELCEWTFKHIAC